MSSISSAMLDVLFSRNEPSKPVPYMMDNPPIAYRGMVYLVMDSVTLSLAIVFTAMRIWVKRMRSTSTLMAEDIFCYIALLGYVCGVVCHFVAVISGGQGNHLVQLSPWHIVRYSKMSFAAQIIYGPVIGCVKLSIICMLRRIFSTPAIKRASLIVMILAGAWTLHPILVALLVCKPIEFNWNPKLPGGSCGDKAVAYASVGVVDLFTDLLILLLPMRSVIGLKLPLAHRINLCIIFGFGFITMIFTAIRLYFVYNIDFKDITYSGIIASMLSSVQMAIAICVASAPLLRPIFDKTIGAWFNLSLGTSRTRNAKYGYNVSSGEGNNNRSAHARSGNREGGSELRTFGRLGGRGDQAGFTKMNDSEEHLRGELSEGKIGYAKTTVGVTVATVKDDGMSTGSEEGVRPPQPASGGTHVTKSTVIDRPNRN